MSKCNFFITPHLSQYWSGWPLKVQVVMWDCNERALLWRSSFGGVSHDSGASSQKMCPVQKDANDMMEFSFFDKKPFLQWKLFSHLTLTWIKKTLSLYFVLWWHFHLDAWHDYSPALMLTTETFHKSLYCVSRLVSG